MTKARTKAAFYLPYYEYQAKTGIKKGVFNGYWQVLTVQPGTDVSVLFDSVKVNNTFYCADMVFNSARDCIDYITEKRTNKNISLDSVLDY